MREFIRAPIFIFESWLLDTFDFEDMDGQDDSRNWMTTTTILRAYGTTPDVGRSDVRNIILRLCGGSNLAMWVNGVKGRYWRMPRRNGECPRPEPTT